MVVAGIRIVNEYTNVLVIVTLVERAWGVEAARVLDSSNQVTFANVFVCARH
jgi:hypothetical protein